MGKTKTTVVTGVVQEKKTSEEKYKEKRAKKAAAEKAKVEKTKVHVPGLKGGQRIKVVESEPVVEEVKKESEEEKKKAEKRQKVRSKVYLDAKKKVKSSNYYDINEAVKLVKETSYSKFDGTVELHLIVKKQATQVNVTLPFSSGKKKKVEIASEETIKALSEGKINFDILLATADMMPKLVPFAKILGPKGLMPNPKNDTIIKSTKDTNKFSASAINIKTERSQPVIHTSIGKVSQKEEELTKNIEAVLAALGGNKQIVRAFVKATMGPSIKLAIA
ncbi:hypothetical protein ACFL1Q_03205 [Patescibacteria group bacterium]